MLVFNLLVLSHTVLNKFNVFVHRLMYLIIIQRFLHKRVRPSF